jgi:hypothetical protein
MKNIINNTLKQVALEVDPKNERLSNNVGKSIINEAWWNAYENVYDNVRVNIMSNVRRHVWLFTEKGL